MLEKIYKQRLARRVASQYNFERASPVMDGFTRSADIGDLVNHTFISGFSEIKTE